MQGLLTIGPARLHQGTVLVLMVLCLALLGGCAGGGSQPFAKVEGASGPSGKTVPPIALLDVAGMPAAKLSQFKDALATAAGQRDMAILDSKLDNTTLTLTGRFTVTPEPAAVKLSYSWTLTDPAGAVLHTISADETAPGAPAGDPWVQITPTVLQRVAAYTAESLSSRLSQLGYATQVGGIPPPLETYAKAGPDADKDIDYETVYGPGKGPPSVAQAQAPPVSVAAAETEPAPPAKAPAAVTGAKIRHVATKPVLAALEPETRVDPTAKPHLAAVEAKTFPSTDGRGDLAIADAKTLSPENDKSDLNGGAAGGKGDLNAPSASGKGDYAAVEPETAPGAAKKVGHAVAETKIRPPAADKAKLAAVKAEPADDKIVPDKLAKSEPRPRRQISAVVVLPVVGAPGMGNADLTRAMRQTLSDAGWPVLTSPRENTLTILGHVKLGPKQAKGQEVALAWTVKTPDGKTLGTVNQANTVPAGSLEAGFGDNALFATQAAASGIYDLVKKYR